MTFISLVESHWHFSLIILKQQIWFSIKFFNRSEIHVKLSFASRICEPWSHILPQRRGTSQDLSYRSGENDWKIFFFISFFLSFFLKQTCSFSLSKRCVYLFHHLLNYTFMLGKISRHESQKRWDKRIDIIGFTLLYFKMAVIPLVSETKMADVGKLISLGNLLVRKVMWLMLTTTSATLILSRDFGADCMTRIAYIHSRLSRTHSFPFRFTDITHSLTLRLTETTHSFPFRLTETTRSLTLRLTEITHSLHFDFQSNTLSLSYIWLPKVNPTKCILSATIFFLVLPLRLDLFQLRKQLQKFRQITEMNNEHGRRHVPPNIHN